MSQAKHNSISKDIPAIVFVYGDDLKHPTYQELIGIKNDCEKHGQRFILIPEPNQHDEPTNHLGQVIPHSKFSVKDIQMTLKKYFGEDSKSAIQNKEFTYVGDYHGGASGRKSVSGDYSGYQIHNAVFSHGKCINFIDLSCHGATSMLAIKKITDSKNIQHNINFMSLADYFDYGYQNISDKFAKSLPQLAKENKSHIFSELVYSIDASDLTHLVVTKFNGKNINEDGSIKYLNIKKLALENYLKRNPSGSVNDQYALMNHGKNTFVNEQEYFYNSTLKPSDIKTGLAISTSHQPIIKSVINFDIPDVVKIMKARLQVAFTPKAEKQKVAFNIASMSSYYHPENPYLVKHLWHNTTALTHYIKQNIKPSEIINNFSSLAEKFDGRFEASVQMVSHALSKDFYKTISSVNKWEKYFRDIDLARIQDKIEVSPESAKTNEFLLKIADLDKIYITNKPRLEKFIATIAERNLPNFVQVVDTFTFTIRHNPNAEQSKMGLKYVSKIFDSNPTLKEKFMQEAKSQYQKYGDHIHYNDFVKMFDKKQPNPNIEIHNFTLKSWVGNALGFKK